MNARYYSSEFGRFINSDTIAGADPSMTSYNLYAYTGNNPVNRTDRGGKSWVSDLWEIFNKIVVQKKYSDPGAQKAIDNRVKAAKNSFVAEVGVGPGFGASGQIGPVKVQGSAYKDMNWGIANNKTYTGTATSAAVKVAATKKLQVGLGTDISHIDHPGLDTWQHNNPMVMPWTVWNCSYTSKSTLVGMDYREYWNTEKSNGGTFIGLSFDAHLIVGGHVKIGFNIE